MYWLSVECIFAKKSALKHGNSLILIHDSLLLKKVKYSNIKAFQQPLKKLKIKNT